MKLNSHRLKEECVEEYLLNLVISLYTNTYYNWLWVLVISIYIKQLTGTSKCHCEWIDGSEKEVYSK